MGPVQRLHETRHLLEPLATVMFTAFQSASLDFSPEGKRVVFEVLADALLPSQPDACEALPDASNPRDVPAANAMLHVVISTFCRRDLAR